MKADRLKALVPSVVYLVISLLTLGIWSLRGVYGLTGDEPHYLVIGDALWRWGSLDVAQAYMAELAQPNFYWPGMGEPGAPLSTYAHVVPGPNGDFSWHGYLLGWWAALPTYVFGAEAARLAMVVIGCAVAYVVWQLTEQFFDNRTARLVTALMFVISYPFLLASVQIFPDFVAGGLVLAALLWLLASRRQTVGTFTTVVTASAVSLLPWIGIKYAPVAALFLVVMSVRARRRWWLIISVGAVSALLLMWFNAYAFGSPFGTSTEGALEFNEAFWIRLAGLLLDQNQGALLYNPILWLGLIGLIPFIRRDRLVGWSWVAAFVALWVLGAAHPGWYGGGSFMGRYGWGMALMLIVPAMVTMAALWNRRRSLFWLASALSFAFSVWVFVLGVFVSDAGPGSVAGLDFYTKPMDTWLESYSVLWFPLQDFFAAMYNPTWVWGYAVNFGWLLFAVVAVLLGAIGISKRAWLVSGSLGLVLVVVLGFVSQPGTRSVQQMQDVQVTPGMSAPGVIAGGPVWLMRDGPYEWTVSYSAELPAVDVVGRWEVIRALDEQVVAAGELPGTATAVERVEIPLAYRSLSPRQYFLRIIWNGAGSMTVVDTGIEHVGP